MRYEWRRAGRREGLRLRAIGEPSPLAAASEEEFITEHYWGYTRQRDGGTLEYRVEHVPWRVWQATEARLDADVRSLYGDAYAEALSGVPRSAFLAEGSPVTVFRPRRLAL